MELRTLVVRERGSRWPGWVDRRARGSVRVMMPLSHESTSEFVRRVARQVSALETVPPTLALVCNRETGPVLQTARANLLRALVDAARKAGSGSVVVVADGSYGLRRTLAALASRLNEEIEDETPVSVRFRAASRPPDAEAPGPIV